jgi:hypothetical protein
MPSGDSVRPEKWLEDSIILFDDGTYSVIWGHFDNSPQKSLGVRWNGEGEGVGYPNRFGNPVWFVEPNFLTKPILMGLHYEISKNSTEKLANIQKALSEVVA